MAQFLWVGVGGFFGAVVRYLVSGWAQRWMIGPFPLGTLVVNVAGCFALGALMAWLDRGLLSPAMRQLLAVGFLGALTTFSTFGYETLDLLRGGEFGLALLSVAANLLVGLLAVWLGLVVVEGF